MTPALRNVLLGSTAGGLGGIAIPAAEGEGLGDRLTRGAGGALLGGLAAGGYNARQGLDTLGDARRAVAAMKPTSHEVTSLVDDIHSPKPAPAPVAAPAPDTVPSLSELRGMMESPASRIPAAAVPPPLPAARQARTPLAVADTIPVPARGATAPSAAATAPPRRRFVSAMDDANQIPTRPDVMPTAAARPDARTVASGARAKAAGYEQALALYGLPADFEKEAFAPVIAAAGRGLMAAAPHLMRGAKFLGRGLTTMGKGSVQAGRGLLQGGMPAATQAAQTARNTAGVYGRGASRAFGQAGQQFAQQAPQVANMARKGQQLLGRGWNAMNTPLGMAGTTAATMAM